MPKTKQQKQEVLKDVSSKIDSSSSVVFCVFDKLNVNSDQQLRAKLREQGVAHQVIKKTLLKKVLADKKIEGLSEDDLLRNITISVGGDEVSAAKVLFEFSKKNEDFKIVGGILDSNWTDKEKVEALAKLPGKDELIAKTIGTIKAPLSGMVNVLAGNIRSLANVLNAIKEQKV